MIFQSDQKKKVTWLSLKKKKNIILINKTKREVTLQ